VKCSDIQTNLDAINMQIQAACRRAGRSPRDVTLIAVSKTVSAERILSAYQAGLRDFGENRVQEAQRKWPQLAYLQPPPVKHLIGHLQSNKVKIALEYVDIIHSVDSIDLAELINRKTDQRFPVLLEVNVGGENSKDGFSVTALKSAYATIAKLPKLEVRGLMTVAPQVDDPEEVRPVFRQLSQLRDSLGLQDLSMGMSDDFEVAIEEGATMVRLGRAIFGERV
jgi:PLP dependent protein